MIPHRLAQAPRADIPGCLWFVRFGANGAAEPGTAEDFESLGAPREGFLWLHMDLADVRTRPLLARIEALPEHARDSLCDPVDHQHLEYSEGIVSGALLDYERDLGGPTSRTDYVRFASGASFFISARRLPMDSVEQTRIAVDRGACLTSPIDLFEMLTDALIDGLARKAAELGAAFDRVEDRIIDQRGRQARPALSAARRDAVRLARQISGLSATIARLETIEEELGEQRDDDLREAAARLVRTRRRLDPGCDEPSGARPSPAGRTQRPAEPRDQRPALCVDLDDDAAAAGDLRHGLFRHEHRESCCFRKTTTARSTRQFFASLLRRRRFF